jgi:hypothetical protein
MTQLLLSSATGRCTSTRDSTEDHDLTASDEIEFADQQLMSFFGKDLDELQDWSPLVVVLVTLRAQIDDEGGC